MKDRLVTNPGRVQLVPVAGQTNIFDMTMADNPTEPGTPLSKATLLKDGTASMYGLTPATALPDDVLAFLGKYNLYCWGRRLAHYEARKSDITAQTEVLTAAREITYAASVNEDMELVDPQTVNITRNRAGAEALATLAPCYISNLSSDIDKVYYLPAGTTGGNADTYTVWYNSGWSVELSNASTVKAQSVSSVSIEPDGAWEYLFSADRSEYQDKGISGGYEYDFRGRPYDNLPAIPRIATGRYLGTGVYGASNPNSIELDFIPQLILIRKESYDFDYGLTLFNGINEGTPDVSGDTLSSYDKIPVAWDGNSVSWYNEHDADRQMNESGKVYYFIAFEKGDSHVVH